MLHKYIAYLLTLLLLSLSAFTQAQGRSTEQEIDFPSNENAFGTWSDRDPASPSDTDTIWVADSEENRIFAYNLSTGVRDEAKEFNLDTDNDEARGIWSNGTTMWVADTSGTGTKTVFAYDISDIDNGNVSRDAAKDITLDTDNAEPRGIWGATITTGTSTTISTDILWVANEPPLFSTTSQRRIFAYDRNTRLPVPSQNIDLNTSNADPRGIWGNVTTTGTSTLWVADNEDGTIYAYDLGGDAHGDFDFTKTFNLALANGDPTGIWSDGTTTGTTTTGTIWVVDSEDQQLYAYPLEGDGTGTRTPRAPLTDREFDLYRAPEDPRGIWSNGTTMWVANEITSNDQIVAYDISDIRNGNVSRDTGRDFILTNSFSSQGIWGVTTGARTALWVVDEQSDVISEYDLELGTLGRSFSIATSIEPYGIWGETTSTRTILWVVGDSDASSKIFAYDLNTGDPVPNQDIVLDPLNAGPRGIWSDGTTLWVADIDDNYIYAYPLAGTGNTRTRIPGSEFALHTHNDRPQGIWSDGTTLWVADNGLFDAGDEHIFAYTLPVAPVLAAVSLAGVDITDSERNIPTMDSPVYIFNSTKTGTINYTGACTTPTMPTAMVVTELPDTVSQTIDNTLTYYAITFNGLVDGTTYTDYCAISVTDAGLESNTLTVPDFTVDTTPPELVAPIGTQTVAVGSQVTLTATISDRAGAILNYAWSQVVAPGSPTVALTTGTGTVELTTDTGTVTTTFTAPATIGDLVFDLSVMDDAGNRTPDNSNRVTISVSEIGVEASANETLVGADILVKLTATPMNLTNPTYEWMQTSGTPTVTLNTPTGSMATFMAPNRGAVLEFEVTATSGGTDFMGTVTVTVDATGPTVTSITAPERVNGDFPITIKFDEDVTGFAVGDITVGNGMGGMAGVVSSLMGSGSSYTAIIMPDASLSGTATVTITIGQLAVADFVGNENQEITETLSLIIDTMDPQITGITRIDSITGMSLPEDTNADTLTWEVVFNEDVNNVGTDDFMLTSIPEPGEALDVNNVTLTVTPVSDANYEVTVSGGGLDEFDGTVSLSIAEGVGGNDITDLADNSLTLLVDSTPTPTIESYMVDNTAPEVMDITRIDSITGMSLPEDTNADTLTWEVVFDDDVNNVGTDDFMLTSVPEPGEALDINNVTLTVTPVSDANYEVTVSGGGLDEFDGTVHLSIAEGVGGNDITDLADNSLALLADSTPTPTIESYTVDNTTPTPVITIEGTPATVSGTFTVNIDFGENVTGFDETDIGVGNGTRSNFASTDAAFYTADITPSTSLSIGDMITIDIAAVVAMDAAGNGNVVAQLMVEFANDETPPRLVRIIRMTPSTPVTNSGTLTWAVVFNEPVNNVDATDFGLTALATSGTAIDVSTVTLAVVGNDGDSSYQVTASGGNLADLNGTVRLNIFPAGDGITDIAGNRLIDFTTTIDPNTGILGVVESYTLENTPPTLTGVALAGTPLIGRISADPILINNNSPQYTFRSSEAGRFEYTGDCSSETGTATATIDTVPPDTAVQPTDNTITFDTLEEGRDYTNCSVIVTDAVGNVSAELAVPDFTVDTIPTVENIISEAEIRSYGIGETIAIQVVFTETVVVTGSPVLPLNNGGQAFYSREGDDDGIAIFNYTVLPRQGIANLDFASTNALSLAGGSINDLSGNPARLTFDPDEISGLDSTRISTPGVIGVSGESGNYQVGDAVTINVQFSEEVMLLPDAGLAADEILQLTLETGDIDRMARFSMLTTTNPEITNDTLVFTYRVEEGDRSQNLAYTSPNALVAISGTSIIGVDPVLGPGATAPNLIVDLTLPALDAPNSLAGSSDIVIGVLIEEQNARLNEILLPKIVQAMSAATVDGITRRIESGGGDGTASLSSGLSSGISDILPSGLASLKDLDLSELLSDLSWLKSFAYDFLMDKAEQSARSGTIDIGLDALGSGFDIKNMLKGFDIKRMLGNSEFVMPLNASGDGTGSGATSSMVLWGSGNYSNLSDNDDGLDYDGDIYSINVGIDSQISQETLLGISVNWSNSDFDYRDATTVQSGDYGYRLYGINPYISWSPQGLGGSNLWATVGYGIGEIENQIEGVDKVETDTRQYQFSGGGRYILTSSADSLSQLSIKGDLTLLRVDIDQSAGFLGNDIDSQSFRLLLQGSSVFNYAGYSFTPSLEGGLRYDLGDGDTGGGIEISPAFTYKSLDDHILIEGRGRYLIAGQHDQWGLSVLARIDQARHGRGLSLSMHPTWGQSQAQAEQLTAHNGSRFNDHRAAKAEAQIKTELSYGMHVSHILGQTMLLTPYAEFTLGENARYYQFGQRLSIGELLNLSFKLSHHQRRGYADDNHLGLESAINF